MMSWLIWLVCSMVLGDVWELWKGVVEFCEGMTAPWHQYAIIVHDSTCVLTSAVEAEKVLGISVGHVLPYGRPGRCAIHL